MAQPVRQRQRDQNNGNIVAWEPFAEISQLTNQLERFLERGSPMGDEGFVPLADIEETDNSYVVEIELPGIKREDIEIEASGRRIAVTGERKERERKGKLRRRTRTVGRFYYEVTLPGDISIDAIEATLDEGVLTLRIPKAEKDMPRRIGVK
jgi:HSP20 family protein